MHRSLPAVAIFAALLGASPAVSAQSYRDGPPPQHRVVYRDLSLFRLNPIGLITDARITYRYRLYEHQSLALRDNFIGVGFAPSLSGAFARIGPTVEFQPASVLQLWATYELVRWFGAFNFLQSYPSAVGASYADTELARRGDLPSNDPLKNYASSGTQLLLGATLQLKAGPIAARSLLRVGRPDYKLRDGDRVFYDIYYDLLTGNKGWFYANDVDLLHQSFGNRLSVGARWSTARALYNDTHLAPGQEKKDAPGAIHRVGPIAAWTFKKPDGARFEPTVIAIVNWWVRSPTRTGQDVSQAFPYMLFALNMTGDLL